MSHKKLGFQIGIKSIVQDYENGDILDYLRGIAHNFNLQAM